MAPGLVPLGYRPADVEAELRRREYAHRKRLEAVNLQLEQWRRRNAEGRQQLTLLRQELEQLRAEQQRLSDPADAPPHPATSLPDQQQAAQERLRQQLQTLRSLRRQITTGVFALISPFLTARTAVPHIAHSKEEPPHDQAQPPAQASPYR